MRVRFDFMTVLGPKGGADRNGAERGVRAKTKVRLNIVTVVAGCCFMFNNADRIMGNPSFKSAFCCPTVVSQRRFTPRRVVLQSFLPEWLEESSDFTKL